VDSLVNSNMFKRSKLKRIIWGLSILNFIGCAQKQVQQTERQENKTEKQEATNANEVQNASNIYSSDEQVIAQGQQLFQNNCSACHTFRQREIGPNLAGVTAEASPAWLKKFIRNSPALIESGDERAIRLFEEYKQYMPPFPTLSETDLEAILAYMNTHKARPSGTADLENQRLALKDPVPHTITKSGLTLLVEEVAQAPASASKIPLARINKMAVMPGKKERLFIQDLRGKLYEMDDKDLRVFMDIHNERPGFIHTPGLATGFGSIAFHPEYAKNGLFYTNHTEKAGTAPADFAYADSIRVALQWVLMEWKMKDPSEARFAGTGRELLRINMVTQVHGVQEIIFNPFALPGTSDYGLLYIGVGDGGAAGAGYSFLCQDNTRPWSSVLRIDPRGNNSQNGQYGIPATNPFAQDADPATVGEIFNRGFRNPNRISWTPDGKMLITDIGHTNIEEVNLGIAGADYGWPNREGTFVLNPKGKMEFVYPLPADDPSTKYTYPVAQYDHDEGNAISGGFVYNGSKFPLLKGKYIFGDIVNGRLFYLESSQLKLGQQAPIYELELNMAGKAADFRELTGHKKTDLRFGQGPNDSFYLFTKTDGRIYKVTGSTRIKVGE
jgi:glucose/arabinose dehydrogenase/cytochrome c551/c552